MDECTFFESIKGGGIFNLFISKNILTQFLVSPTKSEMLCVNSTKKSFENKAFKFPPFLFTGKILFAAWFIN